MSRSNLAPFRREFTATEIGILGEDEGAYVGDIKTLYVNIAPINTAKGYIQGKIGRQGTWFNVPFTLKDGRTGSVDISEVEYIRFVVDVLSEETKITLFGYYDKDAPETVTVAFDQEQLNREMSNASALCEIKDILSDIKEHLRIITGEDDI